ncbi:hypothetical protein K490DRAFT_47488 [Saccharata proteae CBS 121410]|uniref:Apple domain-containing protein n=1 Tax=Saccharata proteae CBS 121410 TaxID=1314787 RepID=A0A9P4HNW4_9PEZI|nr:hypothetical protein K490DRAFT_47488 [Saccharata proteae CBS 121410]
MDFAAILNVPQPAAKGAPAGVISSSASKYAASTIAPVVAESAATTALAKRQDSSSTVSTNTYDVSAGSSRCAADGWNCCALPSNTALAAGTDAPEAFTTDAVFSSMATAAAVPTGYTQAFSARTAAIQEVGYRGVYTYNTYDVSSCASLCTADPLCQSFNIYIERDPIVRPDYQVCTNPPSTAFVKCTLYGYPVAAAALTNQGGYQADFHVVIAGSNGYNKDPAPAPAAQPNFTGPSTLLPGAIEADAYYLYEFYNSVGFDPSVCAAGCQRNTAYDHANPDAQGNYKACNMFNAYVLFVDGVPQGTTCAYFDAPVDDSHATNVGQYRGGQQITVGMSYTYVLTQQDPGHV